MTAGAGAPPIVLVTALGGAEGGRAAAAALACAGSGATRAALLVDLGGRPARPTLLASAAAGRLERRVAAALPRADLVARGRICVTTVAPDDEGLLTLGRAFDAVGRSPVVVHAATADLARLLEEPAASRFTAALVCCEAGIDRALGAATVLDLLGRGIAVALLARRLDWVRERRALFGALPAEDLDGLPVALVSWLGDVAGRRCAAHSAAVDRQLDTNGGIR
ncbi:MAG: hypothetical protein JST59_29650 [Actinobacteria bacterium]|nr:hypothetical protein [Actinomycetota bacterium]